MPITLVIADDHPLILDAMENLFRLAGSQGRRAPPQWRRGPQGSTPAPTGHFGSRHSDAGKRRPCRAPGDEKREPDYASRGAHGYAR